VTAQGDSSVIAIMLSPKKQRQNKALFKNE
jgi:hypothetical protein